jgi:hypothetical protein
VRKQIRMNTLDRNCVGHRSPWLIASPSRGLPEMQLALIALMLGGNLEFYPRLRVAFPEAQSW